MSKREVRHAYPQTRTTGLWEAKDPRTGALSIVGGDEVISEIERAAGLYINASLVFDSLDRLIGIELCPDMPPAMSVDAVPERPTPEQLTTFAVELARQLGLDSLTEVPERLTWEAEGTQVTLTCDGSLLFELSRPTT